MKATRLIRALQNSADVGSPCLWHKRKCSEFVGVTYRHVLF